MQRRSRAFILFLAAFLLSGGCARSSRVERPLVSIAGETMGTEYSVKVALEEGREASDDLVAEIRKIVAEELDTIDRKMSTYREDSELSRLNAHPAGKPFDLSPETYEVLDLSLRVSEETGGAFDVTVGPLVNAWGFGPEETRGEPDARAIAQALERVGYRKLRLSAEDRSAIKARADLYCDLSAVAKGYAVDRVSKALSARGFRDHVVEVGGEVRASGRNARGEPWRIAIQKPVPFTRQFARLVPMSGLSVATSGGYRNFFERDGKTYTHIIDPRTGKPVEHTLVSASVFHPECAVADAYATAMIVLGPEEGLRLAERLDLAVLFIFRNPRGDFEEKRTPAFERLFGRARKE